MGAGAPRVEALDDLVVAVVDRIGLDRDAGPYAARVARPLPWVVDDDPASAYHLKPVVDVEGVTPPWRQVMGTLRQVQAGKDPGRLRGVVEHCLAQVPPGRGAHPEQREPDPVEVTEMAADQWQVSFPEDVHARLGDAYSELEDVLAGVDGVTEALVEDRDRALVRTRRGVDRADLERRLTQAVEALRDR